MFNREWLISIRLSLVTFFLWLTLPLNAADLSTPGAFDQEIRNQTLRQESLEEDLDAGADVRLFNVLGVSDSRFPEEDPCFVILSLTLKGSEFFDNFDSEHYKQQAEGECLGVQGINQLATEVQNTVIARGFVTSRVLIPSQDIASGHLVLQIVPGVLGQKTGTEETLLNLALPSKSGKVLDLRDLEQGLENLQRLPTVTADIKIQPGETPGTSDLVVNYHQTKKWRLALSADDSGSEVTGKNQGRVTLFLDNVFGLSDQWYISQGSDLQSNNQFGTKNYTYHFSFPAGYWRFGFTSSGNDYDQTVAGLNSNIQYSGSSKTKSLNIERNLYRSAKAKTSIELDVASRRSRNFIEDVEVEVQRRHTAYWALALNHRQYFESATLSASLEYRQGERWFGADPAPEESVDNGTALSSIITPGLRLLVPFQVGEQSFRYQGSFTGQWTDDPLTAQDRFSIGTRYTVRGFDGQATLVADEGWYVRNDLGWQIPATNHEVYLGVDYGEVAGRGSDVLLGRQLAGTALGIRGNFNQLSYDLFASTDISKPQGFRNASVTYGFNLHWEF